jgi:exonuclease SbcC
MFRNEVYVVKRNPEYMRPAKRGVGKETKEIARAELVYPDQRVITGISVVNTAIIELTGLDRSQFTQIAMIAQGDFMKMLFASTKDKITIFREIFNTSPYLNLQERLKKDAGNLYEVIEDARKSMLQYIQDTVCAENSRYADMLAKIKQDTGMGTLSETMDILSEIISEDESGLKTLNGQIADTDNQIAAFDNSLGVVEQLAKIQQELEHAKEAVKKEEADFLVQKEKYEQEQAKESIRAELAVQIDSEVKGLSRYDELNKMRAELQLKTDALEKERKNLCCYKEQSEQAIKNEKLFKQELESLNGSEAKLEQIRSRIRELGEYHQGLEAVLNLAQKNWQQVEQMTKATMEYKAASKAYEELERQYTALEKAYFDEQAGLLAVDLSEGQACPVCGATHHPKLAGLTQNAPTETELNHFKHLKEEKAKTRSELSAKAGMTRGQAETTSFTMIERLESVLQAVTEKTAVTDAKINADIIKNRVQNNENSDIMLNIIDNVRNITNKQKAELEQYIAGLKDQEAAYNKKVQRILELGKNIPACEETSSRVARCIVDCEKSISVLTVETQTMKQQADKLQENLPYDNRNVAEQAVSLKKERKRQLDQTIATLKQLYEECSLSLATDRQRIKDLTRQLQETNLYHETEENSNTNLGADMIRAKRREADQTRKELLEFRKTIDLRLAANKKAVGAIEKIGSQVQKTEERWKWVSALANTANGGITGKSRIMLETYIQIAFFERILIRANTRFMTMTGGQYEFKRSGTAGNLRSQSGLDLDVVDHYNATIRSVKSLSGGEAFKASLAMALALSDEIQSQSGGIRIDTMFVDEGFGSLDEESLHQAVRVLNGLSDSNRLVGIISHVSELKELIDKQIIVTKDKTGGSNAKVIV